MPRILRALHVDELRARLEIVAIEHLCGRDIHEARIGHVAVGIGEAELDGLDLQVRAVRAVDRVARHVEMLQDAQRDEGGNALAPHQVQALLPKLQAINPRIAGVRAMEDRQDRRYGT